MSYCECEDIGSNPIKSGAQRRVTEWLLWRFAKSWLHSSWVRIPPRPIRAIVVEWQTLQIQALTVEGSSPSDGIFIIVLFLMQVIGSSLNGRMLYCDCKDVGSIPIYHRTSKPLIFLQIYIFFFVCIYLCMVYLFIYARTLLNFILID